MARRSRVHGRLAASVERLGVFADLPTPVQPHLSSAQLLANKHDQVMKWELQCISRALHRVDSPVILLKGAAYVAADLPPSRGRLYADVDVLVPKDSLAAVEHALLLHGWMPMKMHPYDQRYYRRWMHELPPLQHRKRQTVIDVHHTILPETARESPDAAALIEDSTPLSEDCRFRVLAPHDMVIHSAAHLFYEGEFDAGLRDLLDIRDLLGVFERLEGFWDQLMDRAVKMQLSRPVYYALRYVRMLLGQEIPRVCEASLREFGPSPPQRRLMDTLFLKALIPGLVENRGVPAGLARELLYIRGHYLRMPLHLLIPHLLYKALRGKEGRE